MSGQTHGHSKGSRGSQRCTGAYRSWQAMKSRCLNPSNNRYFKYGGAGITVCDRWIDSFENFLADMGERPVGQSLERRNNSLGYTKDNCRWATPKEQAANRDTQNLGRHQRAKTHCPSGHPYQAPHLAISKEGHRRCLTCTNARRRVAGAR
jgi:hypothetical protein